MSRANTGFLPLQQTNAMTAKVQSMLRGAAPKYLTLFLYLQLLDVLTTLIGFKVGAVEGSPAVRWMIHSLSPVAGLALSKCMAVVLASACIALKKPQIIRRISYWYGILVMWNAVVILECL